MSEPRHRPSPFRWPTRDDRDADHLAILTFAGGLVGIVLTSTVAAEVRWWWMAACLLGLTVAPLLWLRVPHAKWLAVAAVGCQAATVSLRSEKDSLSLNDYAMIGGLTLIAVWYARIDYCACKDA